MLNKHTLLDFLEIVNIELGKKITLVAAGGTAMTLLDLKPSTIDIDFTAPSEDIYEFKKTLESIPHGFKIDCWPDGMVFSQTLPDDYMEKSILIKKMKNIELHTLNPIDIVTTKIGRLDDRDKEDIKACIKKYKITKKQVTDRAKQIIYIGNEENFLYNIKYVDKQFF